MASSKKLLGVKVDEAVKEELEQITKRRGLKTSEAIRDALELWMGFSDMFLSRMRRHALKFNVPLHVVIENYILEKLANRDIDDENWKYEAAGLKAVYDMELERPLRLIRSFPRTPDGRVLTGQAFLDFIKRDLRESNALSWEDAGFDYDVEMHAESIRELEDDE